jgi:hypothetical protein
MKVSQTTLLSLSNPTRVSVVHTELISIERRERDEQKKDYIDRVNDINLKRQQSYSGNTTSNSIYQQ